MRDISNFGNNLRDEIIEYRLEHETGHTLKIKFVDHGDKTNAQIYLYSKTGEFLSKTEEFPFDQTGQRAVDRVELIRGSSEGHEAEYEIKVLFRGGKDPVYCPVDNILATLRKELSNKITIDLDNSGENESSVITSKIYSDFSKDKNEEPLELSESHIRLDDIKMTAQNISMIADAESEKAKPTPVFVADVKDKKVTVYDLDVDNSININKAKIDALDVTGDVKLGTHESSAAQPELAINTTAEFPGVSIEHTLAVKSTASFGNDVNVSGNINVESGTVSSPTIKAANAFSVGKNNEEYLKVDATGIIASGNINASGNMNLIAGNKEVSLTNDDFTINLMGTSDASVTNKKYVNDLVKTERERATNAENDISSSLDAKTAELRSAIEQEVSDREEAVAAEKTRATAAESTLTTNLEAEVERATGKESEISSNLTAETTRAGGAESALDKKITDSVTSLTSTINEFKDKEQTDIDNLKGELDAESDRAKNVEGNLSGRLDIIVGEGEGSIKKAVADEAAVARAAEEANAASIDAEESRATAAENAIKGRLTVIEGEGEGSIKKAVKAESTRAKAEESTIASDLTAEVSRALGVEDEIKTSIYTTNSNLNKAKEDLKKLITDETTRATGEETKLSNSISNEIKNRESAITSAITKEANDRNAAIENAAVRVKSGEKIISLDSSTHELSTTLGLKLENRSDGKEYLVLTGINGEKVADMDATKLVKDGMINDVKLTTEGGKKYLVITFNTDAGKTAPIKLDVSELIDVYTAGDGLTLTDRKFAVSKDSTSEDFLVVSSSGIKITGVQEAINTAKQSATKYTDEEVRKEKTRATGVEDGLSTRLTTAESDITTLNGKPAVEISADQISNWNKEVGAKADIAAEKLRAEGAEKAINAKIGTSADATTASTIYGAINKEVADRTQGDATTLESAKSYADNKVSTKAEQTYVDGELAKKVDKVEGKSLIDDTEIERISELQTRLSDLEVITNKLDADTVEKVKRVSTLGSIRYNDIY